MYSVLLYNYRVTRAVENFKEGKQMSHNKILRTVFGISTGALLFGMNMMFCIGKYYRDRTSEHIRGKHRRN